MFINFKQDFRPFCLALWSYCSCARAAEGIKFNQELQNVQKILAFGYFKNPEMTTEDVAYLLGYSEVSSFSRAFKKWTGQTISEYRDKEK